MFVSDRGTGRFTFGTDVTVIDRYQIRSIHSRITVLEWQLCCSERVLLNFVVAYCVVLFHVF